MSKIKSVARTTRGSKARLLAASSAGAVALALAMGGTAHAQVRALSGTTLSSWYDDVSFGGTLSGFTPYVGGAPATTFSVYGGTVTLHDGDQDPLQYFNVHPSSLSIENRGTVTYGETALSGHDAFFVTWSGVPYWWCENSPEDCGGISPTSTFQFVLYDRSDTGTGNYDFEYNYGSIGEQALYGSVSAGSSTGANGSWTTGANPQNGSNVGTTGRWLFTFRGLSMCPLLSSGDDTCAITSTSVISGTADALGGNDVIQLGGATNFSFDADTVGVNFLNFEDIRKTGASTVTLTGSAETEVYVDQGTLRVAGSVTNANGGAIVVDGAGATVDVEAGGSVTATRAGAAGVYVTAANGSLINGGTVQGYFGAYFNGAGSVTNEAGGVIDSTSNAVAIFGAGTVTNAGTITSDGIAGFNYPAVYIGGGGTVTNQAGGQIVGGTTSDAVFITGGAGTVTNDGLIQGGGNGVYFGGAGTLTNHNTITGSTGNGAFLAHGGSVTNTGTISSTNGRGVQIQTGEGTLTNSGSISGAAYGARLYNGGTVTNQASGVITGAIGLSGGTGLANVNQPVDDVHALNVTNAGQILGSSSAGGAGVRLDAGGTVDNQAGGVIEGATGVDAWGGTLTLTNAGTIGSTASGGYTAQGVYIGAGGTVTNLSGGLIDGGYASAIYVAGGEFSLTNSGMVLSGGDAVFVAGAGTVDNRAGGYISGDAHGVSMGGATTVTNAGVISSTYGSAIYANGVADITNSGSISGSSQGLVLHAGGEVDNQAGGWINGATAIDSSAAALTLTNAGQILGGGSGQSAVKTNGGSITNAQGGLIASQNAISNDGSGDLTVDNAGVLNGAVVTAGTGVLTLTNHAGAEIHGTWSAVDSQGGRIDVDNAGLIQGGSWGVVGRNAGDVVGNSGTITAGSDGVTLAAGGELTNSGVITGGFRGAVVVNGSVDNQAEGFIVGGQYGVDLYGTSTLDNAGTIAAGTLSGGVVTLGGYDGVRMQGGTLNNLAGGVIKSGAYAGIYSNTNAVSISNAGSITSNTGNGLYLRSAVNDVTNLAEGVISGGIGVNAGGGLTLDNAGLIKGTNGNAVYVESGASTITNSGSVISTNPNYTAIYANGGGTLDNLAGGTINGGFDGVRFGGSAVVDNAGSIVNQNANRYAMVLIGGGTLTNREGGSIAGKFRGVYFGATGSVTNDGAISAVTDNAVSFIGGGTVTNSATGVISSAGRNSGGWGVWGAGVLEVDNAGVIDGESGVVFSGTGHVVNRAGGVIDGRLYGVLAYPDAATGAVGVDNAGTISGGTGVSFAAGGTVVNRAGGEISGDAGYGVLGSAGAERVENAGLISGSLAALDLGGGDDTLVMITGGTISGYADGGAGTDAFVLDGAGQGSLDVGLLGGFESQTKIGEGTWTLSGAANGAVGWSVEAGVLRVSGGEAIADTAGVDVAEGARFELASGETLGALSGAGEVDLRGQILTVGADGGDSVFDGVIGDSGGLSYVGSWVVSDGPSWGSNPPVYSGQEAAALLFGGEADDYAISTVSNDPGQVNYSAWMDGWGDTQYMSTPAPQDMHVDVDGDGYADPGGSGTAYSAYVSDHGAGLVNYAFREAPGALVKVGAGVLTLNGANTFSGTAYVQGGTLRIGADERLSDEVTLSVSGGATFDLQGYDETVAKLVSAGTLAGTGTLSADEYWLLGGTVDANLGEGVLVQAEGETLLNGRAGASQAELLSGVLTLGASERFDDDALVQVDEDATWALDGWDETIGELWGEGVVDLGEGGSLTLGWDGGSSTFAGIFTGEGDVTKTGAGVFTLVGEHDFDGALVVEGGQVRMAAILAGDLHVKGGLLAGVGEIGGDLKITGGTVSPGGSIGTGPSVAPTGADLGVFFTNTLTMSGGTLNFGFAGADLDYASDHIVASGAIRLSGGVMDLHPVSAVSQYGFNQQYLLIEGGSLTGQFANLNGDFTANAYEGQLYQRLRYDVVPGGVVLEVRRMVDWTEYDPTLQGPVGEALGGTQLKGSDEWAGVLNTLLDLTPEDRRAALQDMSGEGVANVTASTLAFGDRFQSVMQGRMDAGSGAGAGGLGGGTAFAALPFGQGARSDVMGGMLGVAEAGLDNRPGGWAEAFVVDSTLKGMGGAADADSRGGGFATGADFQVAPSWRVGFALGFSDMQGDTTDRSTASEGRFWHAGAYASYSDGPWYGGAAFSRLTGDLDVDRQIGLGPLTLDVAGSTSVEATNLSLNAGRRFQLNEATELRFGVSGTASKVKQDGYTETGAGGLSLNVGEIERQMFVGEIGARLTRDFDQGRVQPYVGAGAAFAGGDLESLANVGFSGAPTGTGTFVVEGAELPSEWARLEAGVAFKPRENVWVAVGYDGSLAERLQEHRGTVKVSFKW